jgi:hypothetical protein
VDEVDDSLVALAWVMKPYLDNALENFLFRLYPLILVS